MIDVSITAATSNITVHVYDMEIHEEEVSVSLADGSSVEVVGHSYDKERQFYIISLGQELEQTEVKLSISWTGNLNEELAGFYRSSYTDQEGTKKYLATTQFEPTDARRAFPCFDEPAMKAIFRVCCKNVVTWFNKLPPGSKMLSPGPGEPWTPAEYGEPEQHADRQAGCPYTWNRVRDLVENFILAPFFLLSRYVWDEYQSTLKMSTYLLAFVVSDFVFRKSEV